MAPLERRDPRPLCSLVLAAVVLLCWGFLLYGARVVTQRQLESGFLAQGLP